MGSYAYILVAALIMTGSVLLLGQHHDTNRANVELGLVQMKQEARNAAATGLSLTMRELARDQDPWLVASNYEVGPQTYGERSATYETVVTIVDTFTGDTLDVVATGTKVYTTKRGEGRDTTHVIEARIARGILENATPPAYRYAIISDNTLRIHGDLSVNALLPGMNADIHTNGVLDARGNSFLIEGMGSYTTGASVSGQQLDNFVPDNDWNGSADNVFERDSVPIPDWDQDQFRSDAQAGGFYSTDALVIDGDALATSGITTIDEYAEQVLGMPPGDYGLTEDHPFLLMIDNTITFDNATYLSGFVQFGSTGEIDVLTHGADDGVFLAYTEDLENQVAYTNAGIFTTGSIRIEGNATIQATLYSEGSITYLGGTHLIGGQVAKETTFQGGGTIDIDWVSAGSGVTKYFDPYDEPIGPVIVAYAEW